MGQPTNYSGQEKIQSFFRAAIVPVRVLKMLGGQPA
jgi:hypothetical protein